MSLPLLVQCLSLAVLIALLLRMAIGDLRAFIIPNQLNLAIAGVALVYIAASAPIDELALALLWRVVQALVIGMVFAVLFACGWMGGGDVKLMIALALFLPLPELTQLLVFSSLAGGVLALVAMLRRQRQQAMANADETQARIEIPYGIAIAVGGIIPSSQLFVKTAMTLSGS